jgi:hypothetical protein
MVRARGGRTVSPRLGSHGRLACFLSRAIQVIRRKENHIKNSLLDWSISLARRVRESAYCSMVGQGRNNSLIWNADGGRVSINNLQM